MKVLVKKTFNFVDDIWKAYIQQKLSDLRLEFVCFTQSVQTLFFSCILYREIVEEGDCSVGLDEGDELANDGVPETDDEMDEETE